MDKVKEILCEIYIKLYDIVHSDLSHPDEVINTTGIITNVNSISNNHNRITRTRCRYRFIDFTENDGDDLLEKPQEMHLTRIQKLRQLIQNPMKFFKKNKDTHKSVTS